MREISERMECKSISPIQRIFKEEGWDSRAVSARKNTEPSKVYELYFEHNISQQKVAEALGLRATSPIRKMFKEHEWIHRGKAINKDAEVYHLYFEEGLSQEKIAEKLGVSPSYIRHAFRRNG